MRKLAVGGRLMSPAGQPCQYYGWEPHKHGPRLKPFPVKVALLVFKWRNWENRSSDHTLFTPIEPERLPVGNQLNLEFGRGSMSPF